MKSIKKIIAVLVITIVLVIGTGAGFVLSDSGLRWVLTHLPRWVPGLAIAQVEGGWRDLTLSSVQFDMDGVSVSVGQFKTSVQLDCLWQGKLCVNALSTRKVSVNVNTHAFPASSELSTPVVSVSTPIPLELHALQLEQTTVVVDDLQIEVAQLNMGAQWRKRALTVLPTNVQGVSVHFRSMPEPIRTEDPRTATLGEQLQTLFAQPLLADLPDVVMPLDISAPNLVMNAITLGTDEKEIFINKLVLSMENQASEFQIAQLKLNTDQDALSLKGTFALAQTWPFTLDLTGDVQILDAKQHLQIALKGGLKQQLQLTAATKGTFNARMSADVALAEAGLPLALRVESDALQWPFNGEADYQIGKMQLELKGKATRYQLLLDAALKGKSLPDGQLHLQGQGSEQLFDISKLRLTTLQGYADLTGRLAWNKALSWNGSLVLQDIDTAKQWPEWPVKLAGKIRSRGSLYGGNWRVAVPELQLNGHVKNNQIDVKAVLAGDASGEWQVDELAVQLGKNYLNAKGRLGEQWNLDGELEAPNLAGLLPTLSGRAKGKLALRGQRQTPQWVAELNAAQLRWQTLFIEQVQLNTEMKSVEQVSGEFALKVNGLQQGDQKIALLTMALNGNELKHKLSVAVDGKPVAGHWEVDGQFDRKQQVWRGVLSNAALTSPIGEWLLQSRVALSYYHADQKIEVGAHCWRNPRAEVCVPKPIDIGRNGEAVVNLTHFDLALFNSLLGSGSTLRGDLTGHVRARWQPDQALPRVELDLAGNGVALQQRVKGKNIPLPFDIVTMNGELNEKKAQFGWRIKMANNGQLSGGIQVNEPMGQRHVAGDITLSNFSLSALAPLLEKGETAQGTVNANLRLGGNLQQPQVYGELALSRLEMDGAFIPVHLINSHLALRFEGTNSTLEGVMRTKKGQINLAGNLDWRDIGAWTARVTAKGNAVRLSLPPEVLVDVSPDLLFEATPNQLHLSGQVTIPWAQIVVKDLPESGVAVSVDEVLLDENLQPIHEQSFASLVTSDVTVRVGDDVNLDAFGFKAKLKGNLKIAQSERGVGVNGQIDLSSGRYRAYGQDLLINKGSLIFSGPADQPLLNVEAIRNPEATQDGVTAGVRVTGTADAPQLDVFSTPALSQQEALSYLLRGQGLGVNGSSSGMMSSMLIGLGVAKSGKLVGQIGEAFGVSNLSLDTKGVGSDSTVEVSGYLFSDLQIKYGVGIFDSLATLTLRYGLMPKLYLEAASGVSQTLDLFYQFEF